MKEKDRDKISFVLFFFFVLFCFALRLEKIKSVN